MPITGLNRPNTGKDDDDNYLSYWRRYRWFMNDGDPAT
jgi:hypothetical protein